MAMKPVFCCAVFCCVASLNAQIPGFGVKGETVSDVPHNLDFSAGPPGEVPTGWIHEQTSRIFQYTVETRDMGCRKAAKCVVLIAPEKPEGGTANYIYQMFDATPFRGKTVELRAWVRLDSKGRNNRVSLVLRSVNEKAGGRDVSKRHPRPSRSTEWTEMKERGKIPKDADLIQIGIVMEGKGKGWVESVSFQIASDVP
jgi:hypothetical protein